VQGGSFLDILGAVVGLGLQLGSVGVFGSSIAKNINKVPGNASGTGYFPGGSTMVGEYGPERVNLPRGSQVVANHKLGGGGSSPLHFDLRGAVMTQDLVSQMNAIGAQAATLGASGGAALANRQAAYSASRRLA